MNKQYDLAGKVIGLAMKVHNELGSGYVEQVYENALEIELREAGLQYARQHALAVHYRGHVVGEFKADFLVENDLVVELKAVQSLVDAHEVQVVNYLSGTKKEEGLLINFGDRKLEFKKKFRTYKSPHSVHSVDSVKKTGFTLLELMVAMAVLSILVVMMLGLVDSAAKLWRENENRVDAYREARAAMGIMARDLRNMVASTNTNLFLINTNGAFAKVPLAGETNTNRAGAIFFLASLPAGAQEEQKNKSDICEVGYFLGFERTLAGGTNSQQTLNLYRFFRSSNPTYTNLVSGNLFQGAAIGPTGEELLARNIREFQITPLVITNNAFEVFSPSTNRALPDLIEIRVTAVNQEAARRFTNKTDWIGASPGGALTNAQQTFTTRIPVTQPPPN